VNGGIQTIDDVVISGAALRNSVAHVVGPEEASRERAGSRPCSSGGDAIALVDARSAVELLAYPAMKSCLAPGSLAALGVDLSEVS